VEHPDLQRGADSDSHPDSAPCIRDQYRGLTEGAGIAFLGNRIIVRVTGADRVSFMNGMCSNDLKGAAEGSVLPALFLTEHAHIVADFFAWVTPDAILVEIDGALWDRTRQQLEKFIVADDVEMEQIGSLGVVDIEGPRAAEFVRTAGGAAKPPEPWHHAKTSNGLMVGNIQRFGGCAFTILVERETARDFVGGLLKTSFEFPACEAGEPALDIIRVENGLARVGRDAGEKTIALEARLERAISFSKGCYVGQETIERATARGALKKRLCGLRLEGDRPPGSDAAVFLDGKEVGRLTSAVQSPRLGLLGLGILHHSAWPAGTRVAVKDAAGEWEAVVSDLPFK
jgi:folate-binding protein YgfZ